MDKISYSDEITHIPRLKMPERYYTCMIRKMCLWPLFEAASSSEELTYQNVNLYCEPTPFKAWAKVTYHRGDNTQKKPDPTVNIRLSLVTEGSNKIVSRGLDLIPRAEGPRD